MRIGTMLFLSLFIVLAALGSFVMFGQDILAIFSGSTASNTASSDGDASARKPDKWRAAPYVILVPSETLSESTSPPKAPVTREQSNNSEEKATHEQVMPTKATAATAPAAQAEPAVGAPEPAGQSDLAKQALDAITPVAPKASTPSEPVIQTAPKPVAAPAPKPVEVPAPKPVSAPVPKPAAPPPVSVPAPRAAADERVVAEKKPSLVGPQPKSKPASVAMAPAPAIMAQPPPKTPVVTNTSVEVPDPKRKPLKYEAETTSQSRKQSDNGSFALNTNVRFRKAVPASPGVLKSEGKLIRLAGVDALSADEKCQYASGQSWDCGRWATYALRRFIRGRSVVCFLLEEVSENEFTGRCTVSNIDINNWVVRRGWGRPAKGAGDRLIASLDAAKNDKLGQWSEEPAP